MTDVELQRMCERYIRNPRSVLREERHYFLAALIERFMRTQPVKTANNEYDSNGTYKVGVDPEVTCWHCKKTFLCDCMDATCRLCGAPYSKERCGEFNFIPIGER